MPRDPLLNLTANADVSEEQREKLAELLDGIIKAGLNLVNCTYEDMLGANITIDDVEKALKGLAPHYDNGVLADVWTVAANCGVVTSAQNFTLKSLFRFKVWITKDQGSTALRQAQQKAKLAKAGKDAFPADEMTLLRLWKAQQDDMQSFVKRERVPIDAKIASLRAKIVEQEELLEAKKGEEMMKYPLLSAYVAPDLSELRDLCWKVYLQICNSEGKEVFPKNEDNLRLVEEKYKELVLNRHLANFLRLPQNKNAMLNYGKLKIKKLEESKSKRELSTFVASSQSLIHRVLMSRPLKQRKELMAAIPMGVPTLPLSQISTVPLSSLQLQRDLMMSRTVGGRPGPDLQQAIESCVTSFGLLRANKRLRVHRERSGLRQISIPHARSKWEAGIRHIIGGGEILNFRADNCKYRGGGNLFDALTLLARADDTTEYSTLSVHFSVEQARHVLRLPSGLPVPDGAQCCFMKQFNDDASAGPLLRAFGVKNKYGLKSMVESFVWGMYDRVGSGDLTPDQLPCLLARLGFRTKLVDKDKAAKKIFDVEPVGRAVMMLDVTEQAFSSPLFNAVSEQVTLLHNDPRSGWRNYLVRASVAWVEFWHELRDAKVIVELDWAKFDRERPAEDIQFFIEVICSCFQPRTAREERLLAGYKKMMENALVHRLIVLDNGCFLKVDGMVPSGSLWTGICDTSLNILYITAALMSLGHDITSFVPKCAGDDNLTTFDRRIRKKDLEKLRLRLNSLFRAGIKEEDFIIHYPPYHVTTVQACFPPGTDLSHGTSKMLDQATWVPFEGPCDINQEEGRSHRWKYQFEGKPKFLANFFLIDGRPIRPAHDNLEKLLWPEGIHGTLEDYQAAVLAMVVDNPFNHHNVNHMMHRHLIAAQISRQAFDVDPAIVMELCTSRAEPGELVPYPEIAFYRRVEGYVDLDAVPEFKEILDDFRLFVSSVSTLYARRTEGGIDSWRFMEMIRGEHSIGEGQFGNDIYEWCKFLGSNPLTRSLRATRRFKMKAPATVADEGTIRKVQEAFTWLTSICEENLIVTPMYLAQLISDKLLL
uniref:ORF1+2p n=1 Tax=Festuca pratensis amalgavirus 3 TaxID=2058874 RepID=A0A2Z6JLV6_9VIRU|nr:TPA_exp: ORF1+2p [Festuca pratensis amalgavirus 3]